MLGEHSRPVLLELGYAAPDIDRMAAAGVILVPDLGEARVTQ
jgi:hypothetical protein